MSNPTIRGFWAAERRFPAVRTFAWKLFYNTVARLFDDPDLQFMNWGYVGEDIDEAELDLAGVPERDRTMVQLYAHTLGDTELAGRRVVEVGSGRGGGAAWIARSKQPASIAGVDLAPAAVRLATRLHQETANLSFVAGNAMELPLPDASADAVVNVESCHHYADIDRFLAEVLRILRPDGRLLLSDYRAAPEMPAFEAALERSGLRLIRTMDITAAVLAALHRDNEHKEEILNKRVSWLLRPAMREFSANQGSDIQRAFQERTMLYRSWILEKPV